MSKGSTQRLAQISQDELEVNWARTFAMPFEDPNVCETITREFGPDDVRAWQAPPSHLSPDGFILTDFAVAGLPCK